MGGSRPRRSLGSFRHDPCPGPRQALPVAGRVLTAVTSSVAPMNRREIPGLAGWMALCFSAAALGGIASPGEWYRSLERPAWTPPDQVFGPVWTLLYATMAIAAWMVWRQEGLRGARLALGCFLAQLALNTMWSWLFFGWQRPGWAFVEIGFLWLAIAVTAVMFSRIRIAAGLLLLPYLTWVTFAAALNFEIWRLNAPFP